MTFPIHLVALISALALTACTAVPPASGSASSSIPQTETAGSSGSQSSSLPSEGAVSAISPEPRHLLTQEDVDEALEKVMADYSAAAVSVATIQDGQLSQSGAWGWAVKNERPMTADTKVRIASITKVALGMCAMAMTDDGLLDLDAPLSDYWGEGVRNPYSQAQPSVRTLMSHTSSLKDLSLANGLSKLRSTLSSSSAWRNMEPGDGGYWAYSNFGASILGVTLELAANQPLDAYFQARFLQPLEARASLHAGNLEAEEVANLYNASGTLERSCAAQTGQKVPTEIGRGATYFPGGMTISAVDMAKLVAILAGDGSYNGTEYLKPETVAAMEQPQFTVSPQDASSFEQCLILRHQENLLGRSSLYYHTGSSYGVFSLMSYDPETGDGVVVITTGAPRQTDQYGLYSLCSALSQELYARMEADIL